MITRLILATALAATFTGAALAETMKMAVTTSFANSGLANVLLPEIEKDTGIQLHLLIVGTGQALTLGANGDVDAVLVHSRAAEDQFLAEDHATHRRDIMYNDFVVIGPSADPAGLAEADSAIAAFTDIAAASATFVSRGDDSGTHQKEMALWQLAGIQPALPWYKAVGQGMGAALNTAVGMNAYILSDHATWLNFSNKGDLALLYQGDPVLFNQYAYLPVNPDKHPHIRADAAARLEDWLTSDHARTLINGYKVSGEQLFVFNATTAAAD